MKKFLSIILSVIFAFPAISSTNGDRVLSKLIANYKAQSGISANYSISSTQCSTSGTICMQGNQFRMVSKDLICWFDGKTQWSYSPISQEVNIMEPTSEELQMVNPYSIISNFQSTFNAVLLKSNDATKHKVSLTPKSKGQEIASVTISVPHKTYLPDLIEFKMMDGTTLTIAISNYKIKQSFNKSTFKYDKSMIPEGTPTVDLR